MIIELGDVYLRDIPAFGGGLERQLIQAWREVVDCDTPAGGRWSAWRESVKDKEYLSFDRR